MEYVDLFLLKTIKGRTKKFDANKGKNNDQILAIFVQFTDKKSKHRLEMNLRSNCKGSI